MRHFSNLLPFVTTGLLALAVQEPTQPPRTGTGQTGTSQDTTKTAARADAILAGWLMVGSNNEVALAQIATQKAQDPEVKQFAQKMVDDHRQMAQKLQTFASVAGFGTASTPVATRPGETRPLDAGFDPAGGDLDHVALIQELGQKCLESSRKELEQKSGAEFDRCYMNMMVGSHMKSNDMLEVFQRHASSQLKPALAEAEKTVETHLQHAKELCKKVEGSK